MAYDGKRCLTDAQIEDFVLGQMPIKEVALVETHFGNCHAYEKSCFERAMDFKGPDRSSEPKPDLELR